MFGAIGEGWNMTAIVADSGSGVADKWRPFTATSCAAMLTIAMTARGGIAPVVWYVSRDCGKELVDSMRASDIPLYTDSGLPTGARPTDDDFESGSIKIVGVRILPAYITEETTKIRGLTAVQMIMDDPYRDEVEVTPEMRRRPSVGIIANEPVDDIYRAARALEPRQFSPTDDDRRDLAVFLEAIYRDCTYGEALRQPTPDGAFTRMADQIFEHAWYTPSVVEARKVANEGGLASVSIREGVRLASDQEVNQLILHLHEQVRFCKMAASGNLAMINQEREYRECERLAALDVIAARDARIAELKSELALRPAAFVEPEPEPKHNPFQNFNRDPRRMGPP